MSHTPWLHTFMLKELGISLLTLLHSMAYWFWHTTPFSHLTIPPPPYQVTPPTHSSTYPLPQLSLSTFALHATGICRIMLVPAAYTFMQSPCCFSTESFCSHQCFHDSKQFPFFTQFLLNTSVSSSPLQGTSSNLLSVTFITHSDELSSSI